MYVNKVRIRSSFGIGNDSLPIVTYGLRRILMLNTILVNRSLSLNQNWSRLPFDKQLLVPDVDKEAMYSLISTKL